MHEQPIVWIDNDSALAECLAQVSAHALVALDTEFERSRTYYPRAGLIQLNDGRINYLIDPLAIDKLDGLAELLLNPSIVKAVHSCSEDLDVLHTLLGVVPVNILDTQIAAAIAGHGFSMGFGNLVNALFDVDLPKDVTRSDWLQRPLSARQLDYAALDVEYLFKLAQTLIAQLQTQQRLDWVFEDYQKMADEFVVGLDDSRAHRRIKHCWKLNPREYAIVCELAKWREQTAKRRDLPCNRVLKEHVLLSLAQTQPENNHQLRNIDGINERVIRADAEAIFAAIQSGLAQPLATLPEPPKRPVNGRDSTLLDELKAQVAEVAQELQIPTEILAKKKDFQALLSPDAPAKPGDMPESLKGWREAIISRQLVTLVQQHNDITG